MSIENSHIALFDRVVSNQATAQELAKFERQKSKNEAFAKDFEAYKVARLALDLRGFKTEINQVRTADKRKTIVFKRLIPIGIAASLLLGVFLFNTRQDLSSMALFEQHFEPYPYLFQVRNKDDSPSTGDKAMLNYQKRKYAEALSFFPAKSESDTLLFFKGVSFLGVHKADSALHTFNHIVNETSIFREEIVWYKGLTHLLLENQDSSTYFFQIVHDDSRHKPAADKLILELKKK